MKIFVGLLLSVVAACSHAVDLIIAQLELLADGEAIAGRYGITLIDRTEAEPFYLFRVPEGQDVHLIQEAMRGDDEVVWAEDDAEVEMPEHIGAGKGSTIGFIGDRDALYGLNDQFLRQISWTPRLANQPGRAVRLAILDTGLSPLHPRLWHKTVANFNAVEPSQAAHDLPRSHDSDGDGQLDEGTGHGTMVAGLVDQIAPKVALVICRVADSDGNSTAWRLVEGLVFAVRHGAKVANISLGSPESIPALSEMLDWAEERGLQVVAAAGNGSTRRALQPARISNAICVTGVDERDVKASFANWESAVDVCAPATGLKSTWWDGTLGVWSGTSFASPLVAGAVADALRRREMSVLWVLREIVENSGDDIDRWNDPYRGELGTRLNILRLEAALPPADFLRRSGPPISVRP